MIRAGANLEISILLPAPGERVEGKLISLSLLNKVMAGL